jgi:hypothetical protein
MFHVRSGFGAGVAAGAAVVLAAGSAAAASGWTVVSVPPAGQGAILSGVSADSDSDAWTVGSTGSPEGLAYRWNGTSWQQVAVPNNGSLLHTRLYAVSAASTKDAWTVGKSWTQSQYPHAAAYHFDGKGWTPISAGIRWLVGVADIGAGNAYAVGTQLEHWDGTSWTQLVFPSPGAVTLSAISADAANDIWVAGDYNDPNICGSQCSGPEQPFSLHWDGTSWQGLPMPQNTDSAVLYHLGSVDAISPSDVWTVGYTKTADGLDAYGNQAYAYSNLIEHWDGTSWSVAPAPPGAGLTGITSSSPSSVWAVGSSTVLFWDGTSWTTVAGADPDSSSALSAVSTRPGAALAWAVGSTFDATTGNSPFVLKHD